MKTERNKVIERSLVLFFISLSWVTDNYSTEKFLLLFIYIGKKHASIDD